jgi:hypothetical protein
MVVTAVLSNYKMVSYILPGWSVHYGGFAGHNPLPSS